MMHFACFSGFQHDANAGPLDLADEVMMHYLAKMLGF